MPLPVDSKYPSKGFAIMLQNQPQSEDSDFDTHNHNNNHSLIHHNVKLLNYFLNLSGAVTFAYIISLL